MSRHIAVRDVIFEEAMRAGLQPAFEQAGLFAEPGLMPELNELEHTERYAPLVHRVSEHHLLGPVCLVVANHHTVLAPWPFSAAVYQVLAIKLAQW